MQGQPATMAIAGVLLMGLSSACGTPSSQGVITSPTPGPTVMASPTSDAATLKYVALIHNYWIQLQAAEEATNATNVAARVCLGMVSQAAASSAQFVDPSKCRALMIASLPVHERFFTALGTTPAPIRFSADDQVFRSQLPKGIADLKTLISITRTGDKNAILQAAATYVGDFIPFVTDALDDVDPSVVHI